MAENAYQDIDTELAEIRRKQQEELAGMKDTGFDWGMLLGGGLGALADQQSASGGGSSTYAKSAVEASQASNKNARDLRLKALESYDTQIKALNELARNRAADRKTSGLYEQQFKLQQENQKGLDTRQQKQHEFEMEKQAAALAGKAPKGMKFVLDPVTGENTLVPESGKPLVASQTESMAGHKAAYSQLADLRAAVTANSELMGPFMGRANALNPYDTTAQALNALAKTAAQTIGKSLEGGKLAEGDIKRYREMLPNTSDTPEVALAKLNQVERMVAQKEAADIQAFGGAGHDVSKFTSRTPLEIDVTKTLKGGGAGGLINEAQAGPQQLTATDIDAIKFVKENPNAPQTAGIIQKLRAKGL